VAGGEIRRHYQTRLADALIAATALIHNLRLATRNLQHFTPIEGLQIEKPYD
jgi:predicted nucleic acid-binding protein